MVRISALAALSLAALASAQTIDSLDPCGVCTAKSPLHGLVLSGVETDFPLANMLPKRSQQRRGSSMCRHGLCLPLP